MKTYIYLFLLLICPLFLLAQLEDDFSDGDFITAPAWNGDTNVFTVEAGELRLKNTEPESSNISYLYTSAETSISTETTWEFFFRMEFSPSTSNFGRIYLAASNADLSSDQNGYYLKLGGITGSNDALELYRQDGASSTLILTGSIASLGVDPATARVRVEREMDGTWRLFADYSGGEGYILEGTIVDDTYASGEYFGYYCKYTSSRAENFYLDDVLIVPNFIQDLDAPILESIEINSATEIIAHFNETLSGMSLSTTNFSLDNDIGNPLNASFILGNPTSILLTFGTPLVNLTEYILSTTNIVDLSDNVAGLQAKSFIFYNIQSPLEHELLVTEILPDPIPVLGLPEAEFIEIYNPSEKVIELGNIKLKVNTFSKNLPSYLLLPGQYIIICKAEDIVNFSAFGEAIGMTSFPSLTNSGSNIRLINEEGSTIFEIEYDLSWYNNDEKDGGGWSLEMIDLEGPYNCGGNWSASNHLTGGTPAQENSVNGIIVDGFGPRVVSAIPLSEFELLVTFDEAFDVSSAMDISNYMVSNAIEIESVLLQDSPTQVLVTFSTALQVKTIYQFGVTTSFMDCLGNESPTGEFMLFGLAEDMLAAEVLVNEILFDPDTGGSDFIELLNVSDKIFNIRGLQIYNQQNDSEPKVIENDYLFFPGDYIALTSAPSFVINRYNVPFQDRVIKNVLPSFDNDAGNITIKNMGVTIDSFDYNRSMHFSLIDPDGVSLEKIEELRPSNLPGNWHSASALVGFGTPTYENSQSREPDTSPQSNILRLLDKTFSPNGDGETDVLRIGYQTDKAGYFINFAVFDARGRVVLKANNNILIGTEGIFKWDGLDKDDKKVRMGIYIIWAEIFSPDGDVFHFKESCVVADKLD